MATTFHSDPRPESANSVETSRSAVNWAPALAGALVAVATTLILLALGSGLGFAAASPWPGAGAGVTSFAIGFGIWLIVTQWLSSFMGGYLAGRLRTRWVRVHTDEVLFRDTAHGLLAWAVATVVIGGVALNVTTSGTSAVANATAVTMANTTDTLLRTGHPNADPSALAARAEISRLLSRNGDLQSDDRSYLTGEVAAQTGLSPAEAQQRVDTAVQSLRVAADKARKASSALGFFSALSMMVGAFIASVAAAYGGRLRDEHEDAVRAM